MFLKKYVKCVCMHFSSIIVIIFFCLMIVRKMLLLSRQNLINFLFHALQVYGLERDNFVNRHFGLSNRGDQEERWEIKQGFQDDQEH